MLYAFSVIIMDWINRMPKIINKVKFQLFGRGIDDLQHIFHPIAKYDPNGSAYMGYDLFQKFLRACQIFLTTQELRCIADFYDFNKNETINYIEFFQSVRKHMTEKRLATIRFTFDFIDRNKTGKIQLAWLLEHFNAKLHPHVRTRTKTVEQIQQEFQTNIRGKSQDGTYITQQEFIDYYADINSCIPHQRQQYFIDIILNSWSIKENKYYISPQRISDLEMLLYEKIRQKTTDTTDQGLTFKKFCKYFDLHDKKLIDLVGFKNVLQKFGCHFKEEQIVALFNRRDSQGSGLLKYQEYAAVFLKIGSGRKLNSNPVFQMASKGTGFSSTHGMTK